MKKIQEAYTCKVLASNPKFEAALERWTMTTSKRNAQSKQKRKAREVAAAAVVRAKKAKIGDPAASPMEPPCATSPTVSATPACLSTPVPRESLREGSANECTRTNRIGYATCLGRASKLRGQQVEPGPFRIRRRRPRLGEIRCGPGLDPVRACLGSVRGVLRPGNPPPCGVLGFRPAILPTYPPGFRGLDWK
jgi:hypothetical protein